MTIFIALLIGIIIGSVTTYFIVQRIQQQQIVRDYEYRIQRLKDQHQQDVKQARNRSIDGSRAVIKGKVAEQLAPILPNFPYLPSDAKFIGDPIDYIVFDGYSEIKDNHGNEKNLEIVILDIKTGKSNLSRLQKAIAQAIDHGKVRFEVIRPDVSEQSEQKNLKETNAPSFKSKSYSVKDIRKSHSRAYMPWNSSDDERLKRRYREGASVGDLAQEFGRQPGGIRSRLKKLGLKK